MLSDISQPHGSREHATDRYLEGSWLTLYWTGGRDHVVSYGLPVFFPADFNLHPKAKKVKVKVQVGTDGITSAHCVVDAVNCIDEDPARRLEILISAYSVEGRKIRCWGEANQIFYANTLADYLRDVDFDTIARSPRWGEISSVYRSHKSLSL